MQSNTQTKYGQWHYQYDGKFISATDKVRGQKVFTARNGLLGSNFSLPTDYGFRYRDRANSTGLYSRKQRGYPEQLWTGYDDKMPSDPFKWDTRTSFPDLLETALGRLMDDVRGGNQVVVDLAESASTLAMFKASNNFTSRVGEIFDIIAGEVKRKRRHFERLDIRDRTQKILDFAQSRWLEYRYGWQPLAMSVYDGLDLLHKENLERVRTIVATSKRSVSGMVPFDESTIIGPLRGSHRWAGTERCRLVVEMYTPGNGIWDWTSLNPSVIAWELLPLSFVADWFVSVGDSLSYLENWLLWKNQFRSGYITYSGKGEEVWGINSQVSTSEYTFRRYLKGNATSAFKNRIVLTELPLPFAPRIRVNLNAARLLDALTISSGMFRRQIRGFGKSY